MYSKCTRILYIQCMVLLQSNAIETKCSAFSNQWYRFLNT